MLLQYNNNGCMTRLDCIIAKYNLGKVKTKLIFTNVLWGGFQWGLQGHCHNLYLLAFSLCFPPFLLHSLVSIHSTHWFSQCCVDSYLRGGLWLGWLLSSVTSLQHLPSNTSIGLRFWKVFVTCISLSALLKITNHVKLFFGKPVVEM